MAPHVSATQLTPSQLIVQAKEPSGVNACILCTSSEAASTALQEYKQTSAKGAARVLNKQTQSPVTPPTTLMTGEACMQAGKQNTLERVRAERQISSYPQQQHQTDLSSAFHHITAAATTTATTTDREPTGRTMPAPAVSSSSSSMSKTAYGSVPCGVEVLTLPPLLPWA